MKFLYFYRTPLPDARADAIQIINTCAGIANAGADVDLRVESLGPGGAAGCLDYYGVTPGAGRLEISGIGSHWSWPFFNLRTSVAALRRAAGPGGCLFVREVRPYVPGLMARAQSAGLKVIFEAHNISASLVKEKQRKASGTARPSSTVFTMTSPEGKAALRLVGEEQAHGHHEHGDHEGRGGHDDHDDDGPRGGAAGDAPPNLDLTPAPPPPAAGSTAEADRLRKKAEARAALETAILAVADGLICTQKATLEGLGHLLKPGAPAMVLGNGTQIRPLRGGTARDIDVLYCGSLKSWKGVDTLVAAMQTLYPHRLTIVGPGSREDLARLRQAALAVGMLERLTILPPVKPSEVWELYGRAKVGVIPLPEEGYVEARDFTSPLKLFEMMAAGLPILCTRLKSLQEYVSEGKEAVMVPADDPRALAEGLRKLLNDETLRAALSAAARARAEQYSWDGRGRRIVEFAGRIPR